MPDSMETRVRSVELDIARIGQRVQDHEGDIHRFAGLVVEAAEHRKDIEVLVADTHKAHDSIRRLEERFEAYVAEIARIREAREAREREREHEQHERDEELARTANRDKWVRWLTLVALVLAAVSSTAAVLAL